MNTLFQILFLWLPLLYWVYKLTVFLIKYFHMRHIKKHCQPVIMNFLSDYKEREKSEIFRYCTKNKVFPSKQNLQ
jgi:hypothetical protein